MARWPTRTVRQNLFEIYVRASEASPLSFAFCSLVVADRHTSKRVMWDAFAAATQKILCQNEHLHPRCCYCSSATPVEGLIDFLELGHQTKRTRLSSMRLYQGHIRMGAHGRVSELATDSKRVWVPSRHSSFTI